MNGQGRWGGPPIDFGRLEEMFDEWVRGMRENRPRGSVWAQATRGDAPPRPADVVDEEPAAGDPIRVDEYQEDGVHVVRAALPGIEPDRDVEITAEGGALRITAHPARDGEHAYVRRELRREAATRSLPLPERARPADITASYRDGILEIRIPVTGPPPSESVRVNVSRG